MTAIDPRTCECRRRPWVTIAMLGGIHYVRDDGTPLVRCPDRDHCLRGAPIVHGHLGEHWRNMPVPECQWAGIRVRDNMPCRCGGRPWINARTLKIVGYQGGWPTGPLRSVGCPGCRYRIADVQRSRIVPHSRVAGEPCAWSGIHVESPAVTRAKETQPQHRERGVGRDR